MHISALRLESVDLAAQRDFYGRVLGLPVVDAAAQDSLVVQAGATLITFTRAGPGWQGAYHVAFNIPENLFAESMAWLKPRTRLIADRSGAETFDFPAWNAQSVYFYDAAGNILEFIARHGLPNASHAPFDSRGLLCVSEIGLATQNVTGTVNMLRAKLEVDLYDGQGSEEFTAVGDENGLFIVVKRGRSWYPDTGIPAAVLPLEVRLATQARVWAGPELAGGFEYKVAPAPAAVT